jgi:Zn-dependent protease with chaperone function
MNLAIGLAQGGAANWFNPAWLFVNGFYRVFLRVSQGASRLQEVLADRWAAMAYGARAFEVGLRHVITAEARFREHAEVSIDEVYQAKQPLQNLYSYVPQRAIDAKKIEEQVNEELNRAPSPYDSHPAPRDRFTWVHALPAGPEDAPPDDGDAWSLFGDRARIEHEMTAEIRDRMLASGYAVP